MTVEQPRNLAEVWFGNGTDAPVDIYVNGAAEPALSDLKALSLGSVFTVDGSPTRPYQTHRFEVRPKEQPDAAPLAATSVPLQEGESFTAIYHRRETGGGQLSIYANDFSGAADTRLEVRHTGTPSSISWRIVPAASADPRITKDTRNGFLGHGQWQQATEVIENTYTLEALIDGAVVARDPDLELEKNKMLAVYLVGDPQPTLNAERLKRGWLVQEFQIPTTDAGPASVTPATAPAADADNDRPLTFDCAPVEVWETNAAEVEVSARDADGIVAGISVARVDPDRGAIEIPDGQITPALAPGETARATVRIGGDTPSGDYLVRLRANPASIAASPFCALPVTVKPITVRRLRDQLSKYRGDAAVDDGLAQDLRGFLDQARDAIDAGKLQDGCSAIGQFTTRLSDAEGSGATTPAVADLTREAAALQTQLACG